MLNDENANQKISKITQLLQFNASRQKFNIFTVTVSKEKESEKKERRKLPKRQKPWKYGKISRAKEQRSELWIYTYIYIYIYRQGGV